MLVPAARRHTANCDTSHGFRPGRNPLNTLDAPEKLSNQVSCLPDARPACRIISSSPNVWAAPIHISSAVTPPKSSVASLSNTMSDDKPSNLERNGRGSEGYPGGFGHL